MQEFMPRRLRARSAPLFVAALLLLSALSPGVSLTARAQTGSNAAQEARTPIQTVREFYKALR